MNCPKCGSSSSRVLDTKNYPEMQCIRRYRQCSECKCDFVTHERVAVFAGKSLGWVENRPGWVEQREPPTEAVT